jgi:NCS1 family nucleobase:cation symporter-1
VWPAWSGKALARTLVALTLCGVSFVLAIHGERDFLANYTHFIFLLLYVLVPWSAINLVDYYLVCQGNYDVDSFFRRDGGIYGRFNGVALLSYMFGILVQTPFIASDLYTGPIAARLGGADISWVVGLTLTSLVYYFGRKILPSPASATHRLQSGAVRNTMQARSTDASTRRD